MSLHSRSEFLRLALGGAATAGGWMAWPFTAKTTAPPVVSIEPARVGPSASVVHVTVQLSAAPVNTVIVPVATRDGTDFFPDRRALAGRTYRPVSQLVIFRPGDSRAKSVDIPLLGARADQWFELVIPAEVQGAAVKAASGRITFQAGAVNPPATARSRPPKSPNRGAASFELDLTQFAATDSGASNGKPCWRTRFSHGRTQPGNQELGLYTDPGLFAGTRPFEVRDGALVLRAEKLGAPIRNPADGKTYAYGSSVVTSQNLFSQTYGYFEWEAKLPIAPGTWGGLWLLPRNGAWPPEIDVMECPRNGRWGRADSNAGSHWMQAGQHRSLSARLPIDRLLGRPIDLVADFHRHAVEWRRDFTTWFVDDVEVFQAPTHFHLPAYMLMDVAVGGWGGTPDLAAGSAEMQIRSLRVWR